MQNCSTRIYVKNFENHYQRDGAYHFHSQGFQRWWQSRNYRMLARYVRPGMRVLDIACGDGRLFQEPALRDGVAAVGMDLSMAALSHCARRYPEIPLAQADLAAVPVKPASFDLVIVSLALQYVARADLPAALRALRAALKPGGLLLVSYPNTVRYQKYKAVQDDDSLPLEDLREFVRRGGFDLSAQQSISRVVPPSIYRMSQHLSSRWLAWLYFRAVNLIRTPIEKSYHFILILQKTRLAA